MKKLIALLLALIMVCGLATTAFAADGQEPDNGEGTTTTDKTADTLGSDGSVVVNPGENGYTDITQININKKYILEGVTGVSPAETFAFTATNGWDANLEDDENEVLYIVNGGVGTDTQNYPSITVTTNPAYTVEDGATTTGNEKDIVITLPGIGGEGGYTNVGEYHYTLTETDAGMAGVTYNNSRLHVVVTVLQQGENKLRVAAVHVENDAGKTQIIENKYIAGSLKIDKVVTGVYGDRNQEFDFTVTFTVKDGDTFSAENDQVVTTASSSRTQNEGKDTITHTFKLKHGEEITFVNIPDGTVYSISETQITGYDAPTYSSQTGTITNAEVSSTVTNNKPGTIDTGVALDSAPYIVMLVVAMAGVVALVSKKRYEV